MAQFADHFEAAMVILFGISWPVSIMKSLKSKTAKGKSLVFLVLIFTGYLCGIASKIIGDNIRYNFWFYILNAVLVGTDIVLYFRNRRYDKQRSENETSK